MHHNQEIDIVISKFIRGEANPDEAMMLEDWRYASKKNEKHFQDALKIHGKKELTPNIASAWDTTKTKLHTTKKITFRKTFLRIAAVIMILVGITSILYNVFKPSEPGSTEVFSENITKEIQMEDGTDIMLAPYSSIRYDENFNKNNRTIYLNGSAYFATDSKENDIPLLIDVGNVYIKDIGTKFNVRTSSDTDTVFVHVDEGLVILFDSLGSEITIIAGEGAIYIKSSKEIQAIPMIDLSKQFSFKNTPLHEVLRHLNKAYKTNIKLKNTALSELKITVSFDNENIETVLMIITETLDLRYERTQDGYIIMN